MISRPENLNVWVRTQTYIETLKTENETFEGHFKVWVKFEFEAQTFGFFVGRYRVTRISVGLLGPG